MSSTCAGCQVEFPHMLMITSAYGTSVSSHNLKCDECDSHYYFCTTCRHSKLD